MTTCKNCDTVYKGNFCPHCGQRPNSGRIIFKESARDAIEHYFGFDTPLINTIKGMIFKPGATIREYIQGKRKSYSHPFRFFIFSLAVYLIVKQLIGFDPMTNFSEIFGARELPNPNSVSVKGSNFFSSHINLFLLIFAFTLSAFSKLFFRKSGFYFVEYLVLAFFVISEYILATTIVMITTLISPYFFILNYLLVLFYPIYVLLNFHQQYNFWDITKTFVLSLLAWLLYAFLGQTLAIYIVIFFNL